MSKTFDERVPLFSNNARSQKVKFYDAFFIALKLGGPYGLILSDCGILTFLVNEKKSDHNTLKPVGNKVKRYTASFL